MADEYDFQVTGPGQRRTTGPVLTLHVPVRFPSDLIAAVKIRAEQDGMTVSSWIRQVIRWAVDDEWLLDSPEVGKERSETTALLADLQHESMLRQGSEEPS